MSRSLPVSAPAPVRDLALLLARLGLGVVFIAHGWQKFSTNGLEGTAAFFEESGVPLPTLSAWFAATVELVGGGLLIAGLAVPLVGLLLAADMFGAYLFVHAGNGVFVGDGGWELVLSLGVASLVLAAVGAGRWSLDDVLVSRTGRPAGTPASARV